MTLMRCTPLLFVTLFASLEAAAQTPPRLPVNPSGVPLPGPGVAPPTPTETSLLTIGSAGTTRVDSAGLAMFCVPYDAQGAVVGRAQIALESEGAVRAQRSITAAPRDHDRLCIPLRTTTVVGSDVQDLVITIRATTTDPNTRLRGSLVQTYRKQATPEGGAVYVVG